MARVVQRRSNPPYLLIVFVFLFVVSAALAVVFYTQVNDAVRKADAARADESKLRKERDSITDKLKTVAGYIDPKLAVQDASADSLADGCAKRMETLWTAGGAANAGATEGMPALAKLYTDEKAKAETQAKLVADLQGRIDGYIKQQEVANKAVADAKAAFNDAQTAFNRKVTELEGSVKADRTKHDELLKQAREKFDQDRAAIEQEKANLGGEITKRDQKINDLEMDLVKLKDMVARSKVRPELNPLTADGKVLRVLEDQGICYIDLNASDGIKSGLPFEVHPSTGMPASPDTAGKASLEVRNVADRFAECRIVRQDKGNPIVAGDLVSNVAFDKNRTYTFVVEGLFDLSGGAAKPNTEDAKAIRDLIRRAGGKVKDELDYDVDFLVLGEEPPAPPAANDNPQVKDVYEQQMAARERYRKMKESLKVMPVYVLNLNRFMTLTGTMPQKSK
jgi:hypothetical protein